METRRCYGCMKIKSNNAVCEHCGFDESTGNKIHQLPMGTVLNDQYLIGKVLGQGGFGITYLGWDLYLDIPVAVKEFFPSKFVRRDVSVSADVVSYSAEAEQCFKRNKERFWREARALAKVSQLPEIVQIKNLFIDNNTVYIVMEYVEGISLREFVERNGGKLSFSYTFEILKPIMRALCKVHQSGLIHRDISPDNIMMTPDGTSKLLDFGAVRDVENADVNKPLDTSTETLVKRGYAPPEQYQNRGSLGPWTDVYALCATMYYCLTGTVPPDAPERLLGDEELCFEGFGLSVNHMETLQKGMALIAVERIRTVDDLLDLLEPSSPMAPPYRFKKYAFAGFMMALAVLWVIIMPRFNESDYTIPETTGTEVPENAAYQGMCGEDAYYSFDPETKTLTISGNGEMYNYNGYWQYGYPDTNPIDPSREFAPWSVFGAEIESVDIKDGITRIGENAFESAGSIQAVTFGKDLKSIGSQAFLGSGIREVVLQEGLEVIEGTAFNYCKNLEMVVLPESLSVLQVRAFSECPSLKTVVVGDQTRVEKDAFHCSLHEDRNCFDQLVLYVTSGSEAERSAVSNGYTCAEKR